MIICMSQEPVPVLVSRAIEIAAAAHHCQERGGGLPYILHPLRVMLRMAVCGVDDDVRNTAAFRKARRALLDALESPPPRRRT